jgi:hypothetical protein
MASQWWVWLHVAGVLFFVAAHGVSIGVSFRLRTERDPGRVSGLLQLSAGATRYMYVGLLLLIGAGVVSGFGRHWWGFGWIWTALAILVVTIGLMLALALPYYRRVRTIAAALEEGSAAVSPEQFAEVLASRRPHLLAAIGAASLLVILWLMLMKPF